MTSETAPPGATPPSPGPGTAARTGPDPAIRLGLRANLAQFSLLVAVNALVGGTLGQERTVVPLLATQTFRLAAFTSVLTFILAFGAVKAVTNFFAGTLSDRFGRKPVLIAGWLAAIPIPLLLIWAPNWGWVVAANVLLGINQGLTWSTTVIMKIDLVGPARRGLAMGLNEAAGYGAVAITALATGYLASYYGLRPAPFLLGAAYIALGLGLSAAAVRETRGHARHEAAIHTQAAGLPGEHLTTGQIAWLTSFRERALSAACQAGMINNLNDGLAWGVFPVLFARHGLSVAQIGILAALYPAVWGAGQLATGALSDRIGRKGLIVTGMLVQALAISLVALGTTFTTWAVAAVILGAGTAMVYPTLLATIGDVAHPAWRARGVGVYRLWRDGGFAIGALLAGAIADAYGMLAAIWVVAALTAASGIIVAIRMYETRPARPAENVPGDQLSRRPGGRTGGCHPSRLAVPLPRFQAFALMATPASGRARQNAGDATPCAVRFPAAQPGAELRGDPDRKRGPGWDLAVIGGGAAGKRVHPLVPRPRSVSDHEWRSDRRYYESHRAVRTGLPEPGSR